MPITISGGVQLTGPVTLGPGAVPAPTPGAENFGYIAGGGPGYTNKIEKYSFTSDGNSTNVGTLVSARSQLTGNSSDVSGYAQGGYVVDSVNQIDKWPFASDGAASFVGNLSSSRRTCSGQSSIENGNGYQSGGLEDNPPNQTRVTKVDKFSFASDGDGTKVLDLTYSALGLVGSQSTDNGYSMGGMGGPTTSTTFNNINKFPFTSDTNATDIGDLTVSVLLGAGHFSSTNGYYSGGWIPGTPGPGRITTIQKFPFASDSNATDVADLTVASSDSCGTSSKTFGYVTGGEPDMDNIQKFEFASDGDATNVGNLTVNTQYAASAQY
jgi:hypothetical protein